LAFWFSQSAARFSTPLIEPGLGFSDQQPMCAELA
jgi:hypothetical protein